MKKFFFLTSFSLIFMLVSSSCKKDPVKVCNSFNVGIDLQDEINGLTTAAQNYSENQSPANCQAYKNAYEDYIDALRGLESCARAVGSLAAYNESLNDAINELDSLC